MKRCLTLLIFSFIMLSQLCFSSDTIRINYSDPPTIDGVISEGEWDRAESVQIALQGEKKVTIYYLHDGDNLYFAFLDNLFSMMARFPEVMLDINNAKSDDWQSDDWWFHVSGANCANQGEHSVYNESTCKEVQPDWEANNFVGASPDTIEIKIPFVKVNITNDIYTIGIGFDVTDTFSNWEFWPLGLEMNNPSTWAEAEIIGNPADVDTYKGFSNRLLDFPNVIKESVEINYTLLNPSNFVLKVFDTRGLEVLTLINGFKEAGVHSMTLDASELTPGIYLYRANVNSKILSGKFIIIR